MDLFCVSTKSRREQSCPIIRTANIEARPRRRLRARNSCSAKHAQRQSTAMSHPSANPSSQADVPGHDADCSCAHCSAQLCPRSACGFFHHHVRYQNQNALLAPGGHRNHENLHHSAPMDHVYVHPYFSHHYRFPVVDHSTTCYGYYPTAHPACYIAVVPASAIPKDVEFALLHHRTDLVAMARVRATEELLDIRTFPSLGALHQASMQLEVWDAEAVVGSA
ncbi:hypothetical protein F5Y14DRAFT_71728 [Nemania sp. NC0429]|nr:hypothetical protein F5Y14DRAFT_71728 [Nemania sp. NC0429]